MDGTIRWVPDKKINVERVVKLLEDSTQTRQFTNYGPNVKRLETLVREKLKIQDTKSVICVSNATHGLWATISAFEMYRNKTIHSATQSLTFPASAQGCLQTANILDVDEDGGLDLRSLTTEDCIIVTNIFGNLTDLDKYEKYCLEYNKLLIFDNAATPFSFYKGINSCNFGNASVVSFHHTKPIGFGEGGCVIIDNKYESCLRKIINFGFDENHIWHRSGSNYKMSDISAVYIIQHLENIETIVAKHKNLQDYFMSNIPPHIKVFPNNTDEAFLSCFCILIERSIHYLKVLNQNGIQARKYYEPLISKPNADGLFSNILCIPCTTDMMIHDIDRIIQLLTNE